MFYSRLFFILSESIGTPLRGVAPTEREDLLMRSVGDCADDLLKQCLNDFSSCLKHHRGINGEIA